MIGRFFAFVPGVKHLVVLRAACLAISSLANIGFVYVLSLIHISEPTRREWLSRMPSSA